MTTHYGITQQELSAHRYAFQCDTGCHGADPRQAFGYYMAQLAQTYRTRKVMRTVTER